jgi:DNA-binding LacI/PurR family transcriptional regulator
VGRYGWRRQVASGRELCLDFSAAVVEYEGRPAVLVVALDISDRKRAEPAGPIGCGLAGRTGQKRLQCPADFATLSGGERMARSVRRVKRVTIRDVARAAGVSVGAASTALSKSASNVALSKETRDRVLRVARELRYRPLAAARAMAGMRSYTVGVLATEYCMLGSFYSNVLRAIANQTHELGYNLMLKTVRDKVDMEGSSIFSEQHIDGVIIPSDAEQRTNAALLHYDIPHIWLNTELHQPYNCVHVDDVQGTTLAVDHLVSLGHRRIAFMHHFTGERHHITIKRERGYLEGLRRHGLEPVSTYDQCMDIGEHVDLYLSMKPRPTGLVMFSDAMAILACIALVRRGLRIPQDMSVVGHEGVILHEYAYCKLTTVRSPVQELGRTAVRMLQHQFEKGEPAPSVVLPETLEVNESSGPPPEA